MRGIASRARTAAALLARASWPSRTLSATVTPPRAFCCAAERGPTPACPPAELGQLPGEEGFWRFNRTQDYGPKGANETPEQLKATFGWS